MKTKIEFVTTKNPTTKISSMKQNSEDYGF